MTKKNEKFKNLVKELMPPFISRKLKEFFGSWQGNFKSWDEALTYGSSYDAPQILEKVKESLLKVKAGEAKFERDSVLFFENDYNYPLLASLLFIANNDNGVLNVLDFGGSLGSTYFQNRFVFNHIKSFSWSVVEQSNFVACGQKNFEDENLKFYLSIEDYILHQPKQTLLLSSVIQYIKSPFTLIEYILQKDFKYIIIDRTPFFTDMDDRITVQRVPDSIYKVSYPCHIFNEKKFIAAFKDKYDILFRFTSLDKCNLDAEFAGFLLKIK